MEPCNIPFLQVQQQRRLDFLIDSWACSLADMYDISPLRQQELGRQLCEALLNYSHFLVVDNDDETDAGVGSPSTLPFWKIQQLAQCILDMARSKWNDRQNSTRESTTVVVADTSAATGTTSSFSWFDQLQTTTASVLLPRVMIDDIESASTLQDQMQLLLQIEYMDDVSMDWQVILPILQRGLHSLLVVVDGDNNTSIHYKQLLDLIKAWYRQCRSSPDMVSFQYDLCNTLMEEILNSNHPELFSVVQLWHEMWTDIMTFYYDSFQPNLERMEWIALLWLRLRNDNKDVSEISFPVSALARLDPLAKWCSCWMIHFATCPYRLSTILQQSNILPLLFAYLNPSEGLSESVTNVDAVQTHCLAIVCTILGTTRVSQFPWTLVVSISGIPEQLSRTEIITETEKRLETSSQRYNDDELCSSIAPVSDKKSYLSMLFDLFLNRILREIEDKTIANNEMDNEIQILFTGGIEVILFGCWSDTDLDSSFLSSLLNKVSQGLDATGSANDSDFESMDDCRGKHFLETSMVSRNPTAFRLLEVLSDLYELNKNDRDTEQHLLQNILSKYGSKIK